MASRILIVEDNAQNLELMGYLLAAAHHDVFRARSGAEAMAILADERPDVIFCDIQMPGINGFEFLDWLREQPALRRVPVVAVTALAMVGDRERILAAGFDGYLSKPIEPTTFFADIAAWLDPGGATRAPPPSAAAAASRSSTEKPVALVVDNLEANREFGAVILENLGYRVVQAIGIGDAMHCLESHAPQLILSDVCMGDGSGLTLLQSVRQHPTLKATHFVLITSTVDNETERRKGLALGADRYLFRPIEPQALAEELRACAKSKGHAP